MKALFVETLTAMDIAVGLNTVEFVDIDTDYRGELLIVATQKEKKHKFFGMGLCVVDLWDVNFNDDEDIYEWDIDNVRIIEPCYVDKNEKFTDFDDRLKFIKLPNEVYDFGNGDIREDYFTDVINYWLDNGFITKKDFEDIYGED